MSESLPIPKGLDPGIAHAVKVLRDSGVETYESCEGGEGHAYPYPCVRTQEGGVPSGSPSLRNYPYQNSRLSGTCRMLTL